MPDSSRQWVVGGGRVGKQRGDREDWDAAWRGWWPRPGLELVFRWAELKFCRALCTYTGADIGVGVAAERSMAAGRSGVTRVVEVLDTLDKLDSMGLAPASAVDGNEYEMAGCDCTMLWVASGV
jgi:hypothetical protein